MNFGKKMGSLFEGHPLALAQTSYSQLAIQNIFLKKLASEQGSLITD